MKYFPELLRHYLGVYIAPRSRVLEFSPQNSKLTKVFQSSSVCRLPEFNFKAARNMIQKKTLYAAPKKKFPYSKVDHILLNGILHQSSDIQALLDWTYSISQQETRIILIFYNSLWRPLLYFAKYIGISPLPKMRQLNWVSPEDVNNFLFASRFEKVRLEKKILIPFWIPFLSDLLNRYLAPLPGIKHLCLLNIVAARPLRTLAPLASSKSLSGPRRASVSVVVPARNEAGNIENIIQGVPRMGAKDELIFIEGGSTDETWDKIRSLAKKYSVKKNIRYARQNGRGKGDAVRKGFAMAKGDILMILDADLTVAPQELPRFYDLICRGAGEFINGSRLVYPMEDKAMRFLNILGNKFFALLFSSLLGQSFKDTLCGTKVLWKEDYKKIAANRDYFGKYDPFGDFDLLFGASRLNLKIVELPIHYKERVYGTTNIARWRHGALLLGMAFLAARKIKFI